MSTVLRVLPSSVVPVFRLASARPMLRRLRAVLLRSRARYALLRYNIGECPLAPHADMKSSAHLTSSF
eukprot:4437273-Prymnesium_polylepis.1